MHGELYGMVDDDVRAPDDDERLSGGSCGYHVCCSYVVLW